MAWNCTGMKLASGSVDQTARVWHIEPHGHVYFLILLVFVPGFCQFVVSLVESCFQIARIGFIFLATVSIEFELKCSIELFYYVLLMGFLFIPPI